MSRALLAAYPARLRRKHGAELIETLIEMAGPGRPTRTEKGWLVFDGLRERFRPPTRRPLALIAAVLALLIGGALGAAAGSWLGTFGYAVLPDAGALGQRVLPQTGDDPVWGNSDNYFSVSGALPSGANAYQVAEQTRQKLAAEGWQTGPLLSGDGSDGILANVHFTAQTGEVQLDVYAYPDANGAQVISISGWPQRPAAYVPLTVAGALLGLAAGWLIGVALAHRIQAARRPRRSAILTTTGLALAIPSAAGFIISLLRYLTAADPLRMSELVHAHGFAFGPTIEVMRALDMAEGSLLTPGDLGNLWIWGFALIAVAAILARPGNDPATALAGERVDAGEAG
ncbi:hypothetical protein DMB66_19085 [Actinoplanes sp. ATCC 53533]|uniref:hypothetical protein n=1 Tax=Actinoplanes sp. ATCC 53533 TaxID=1288362 RepID=UPI000F77635E|nr:hypothetical protein [Actinoplanes sp. ATCC 53533]RSM64747.1 hypothetical protein DMB66_19085 [Actinoplanes sp. ATCC 53533]